MARHFLVALVCTLCVPLVLAGCVSTSTFDAKQKEADQLKEAVTQAEARNKELRDAVAQAEARNRELTGRVQDLQRQLQALTAERDRLQARVSALESQMADLTQKYQGATQQSEALRREAEQKEQELARLKSTYDQLVSDLKKEIEAGEIKVTQFKDLLTVNLVEKILFDSGKAEIKPRGLEVLKKVGDILKNTKDKQIRIEGHTDNVPIGAGLAGKFPTNWELSTARATVVARYFQEKVGIPPQKLAPTGFAEYRPVASNSTPEGRAQNRRIEIILAPLPPASPAQ
jgi:chemotaxis protein MotB